MEDWEVQGSPEWLEFRRTRIGASDVATIMGINPWKTPLMLWEEKVLGTEFSITPAMQRGHDLEDEARELYQDIMGYKMTPEVFTHPKYPWMMASLDGYNEEKNSAVEIKCPGAKAFARIEKKGTPEYYKVQMNWQYLVKKLDHVDFFAYFKMGEIYKSYFMPYAYDFDLGIRMIHATKKFYRCMVERVPPQ